MTEWRDEDKEKIRFESELEFVQALANPKYLHYLAQRLILQDDAFIAYLKYLLYWKQPRYSQFIVYPHSLYFLDLLQNESFREKLKVEQVSELIHEQQFYHWQFFNAKPINAVNNTPEANEKMDIS